MHSYVAFNTYIKSELLFPELVKRTPARDFPSVQIRRADIRLPDSAKDKKWHCTPNNIYYSVGIGQFQIRDGTEILIDVPRENSPKLRKCILGPVFNSLLSQRLPLVLHASAIQVNEGAVAFIGPSGRGKSTTAAACRLRGHTVLSDDVAALEFRDDVPYVIPGFSAVKLDPDAKRTLSAPFTSALGGDYTGRHHHHVDQTLPSDPIPLNRIYLLEEGETVEISDIPPRERLTTVAGNTFAAPHQPEINGSESHFTRCAKVVDAVPIQTLSRPKSFDRLTEAVVQVERDQQPQPSESA